MSNRDEGYIKFLINWNKAVPLKVDLSNQLFTYRQKLFDKTWIGVYPDGIGFGNISQRTSGNQFLISGSATGALNYLTAAHFSEVTSYNIKQNTVTCVGPIKASSESLSHAIVYETLPKINVVLHIHDKVLWNHSLFKYPTTPKDVPYGTPKMAYSIQKIIQETTWNNRPNIIIMAGHDEGIIAFGRDMEEAFEYLNLL